jgi:hypothetical protein
MRLSVPLQMVRPKTYEGKLAAKKKAGPKPPSTPLQDEATRAWNIHTALYYKAGGIPWRLLRDAAELTTCFVGISFYRSLDGARLLTSVAQVFNERGEGVIVKGGPAQLDKDDKTPHLSESDAHALLKKAIQVYRQEHRTSPARIAVHKTSRMTPEEPAGFEAAAQEHVIDTVELLTVRRSLTRIFREGTYPPLRGTFLELQNTNGLLYLKGSVNFFETYPGMYVPRPLEFTTFRAETPLDPPMTHCEPASEPSGKTNAASGRAPARTSGATNGWDQCRARTLEQPSGRDRDDDAREREASGCVVSFPIQRSTRSGGRTRSASH